MAAQHRAFSTLKALCYRFRLTNMFPLRLIFLLLLTFGLAYESLGQQYPFKRFTSKEGLPQNQSRKVVAGASGYLWVAAYEGGIAKFNGSSFEAVGPAEGLTEPLVTDMLEVEGEYLWVSTKTGIFRYDGSRFDTLPNIPRQPIAGLEQDEHGRIWWQQPGKGPAYFENGRINYPFTAGNVPLRAADLLNMGEGVLYLATAEEVFKCEGDSCQALPLILPEGIKLTCLLKLAADKLAVGTTSGMFTIENGTISNTTLQGTTVLSLYKDSREQVWLGTHAGTLKLTQQDTVFLSEANGLSGLVSGIAEDFEGGLWFATFTGLYRLNNQAFLTFNQKNGLSDNLVWSVTADRSGRVWLSTEKGVDILSGRGRAWQWPNLPKALQKSSSPIVADPKTDGVLVGGNAEIIHFDGKAFHRYPKDGGTADAEFYNSFVWLPGHDSLLLGGSKGISVFSRRHRRFSTYLRASELEGAHVNALAFDAQNRLWIGTEGAGLFIREKNGQLTSAREHFGFSPASVNVVYPDAAGNLWIGTSGYGIYKVPQGDPKKGFINLSTFDIASENIYSITQDDQGNLWAGTDRGLSKFSILQNDLVTVRNFSESEGFTPVEVCHNALHKDSLGHLWFGTVGGVVRVDPKQQVFREPAAKIRIKNVQLFFEPVDWEARGLSVNHWKGLPRSGEVVFESDENHLIFDFEATAFAQPEKTKYQWKLEGLDRDWTPPSALKQAVYPSIPPGNYTFRVRAVNVSGVVKEMEAPFVFQIESPFYKTRSFTIGYILLFIAVVYLYVRQRFRRMRSYQAMLKVKVRRRTHEIEQQKHKLQTQSKKLSKALAEINKKNTALVQSTEKLQNSLAYAQKIQEAVMFGNDCFQQLFGESFVFCKPKEVVKSDFYWAGRQDDKLFLVLADCTGHGVPGAFMSLLGYEYLGQVISQENISSPAAILEAMDQKINKTLGRGNYNLVNGIDMAVCCIDLRKQQLLYAGARRPLLICRPNGAEQIKGAFRAIGIPMENRKKVTFTDTVVDLNEDLQFYLFSDGFPNQFDTNGKKYTIGRFRDFLGALSYQSTDRQLNQLEEEYHQFTEGHEQVDDILIIGFRYTPAKNGKSVQEIDKQKTKSP